MNLYSILLSTMLVWMPTIDNQRSDFGTHEPPYWLGISVPPSNKTFIDVYQLNEHLFTWEQGTEWDLYYVTQREPIYFYENGNHRGAIIPEPGTFLLVTSSLIILRNQQKMRNRISSKISLN